MIEAAFGKRLRSLAANANQRCLVVLQGNQDWGEHLASLFIGTLTATWVNHRPGTGGTTIDSARAHSVLGQDLSSVVYNVHNGLDPDAFGILSGAISGGGLFIVLTPALSDKAGGSWGEGENTSRYLQRCARELAANPKVINIRQNQPLPDIEQAGLIFADRQTDIPDDIYPALTTDQAEAIDAVHKVVSGQRKRPAVLLSDRGRGKSAALGIAAAQLTNKGADKIIVTGRNKQSLQAVFKHAEASNPEHSAKIKWLPVEQLLSHQHACDLLLIDEAASIPLQQLETLLARYSRIAMATTVHGYEGTGRGFMLRFGKTLDQLTRGWKQINLKQPIRWAAYDPLEQVTNSLLLLDATLAKQTTPIFTIESCDISLVKPQQLMQSEPLLRQVFSLLVLAHYKTRPGDLKQLLDNPALSIYQITAPEESDCNVVGIAATISEGGLDSVLAQQIFQGIRRPAGQVLPEILGGQLGQEKAAELKMTRVMRIVIHPSCQSRGFGSHLMRFILNDRAPETDIVGSHFASSPELCNFWLRNGFQPVRVSLTLRPQSGSHSIVYLKSCSHEGDKMVRSACSSFAHNLPAQLKTVLRDLDPDIVEKLLLFNVSLKNQFEQQTKLDLQGYFAGARPAESIAESISRLVLGGFAGGEVEDAILLIERVLQGKSWTQCRSLDAVDGKRSGDTRLRKALLALYHQVHPDNR